MLHWSTKDCQEDAEIGKFCNLILPTDRNCPWGENHVTPTSVTLNLAKKQSFTCHQTLVHCLMDISITYIGPITIQFIPSGLNLSWSHQFTSGCPLQGTMITLIWVPGSYLHHRFRIQCQWSRDHYDLVLCSARGTRVWMWIHARAVTVTKEYWNHLRP